MSSSITLQQDALERCGITQEQLDTKIDVLTNPSLRLFFAPYPEDLCKIPMLATCPQDGTVLDPFTGTGTTNFVAFALGRNSLGIDIADEYLTVARERCRLLL